MSRMPKVIAALAAVLSLPVAAGAAPAVVPQHRPQSWHEVKCARYRRAWAEALARFGPQGPGRDFLDRHDSFLASNCTAKADVCPRSAEEFRLANIMVILAMNAGTASTFPPFGCPR